MDKENQIGVLRRSYDDESINITARELLEALQSCVDYGSMTGDEWVMDKARAAIAKAEEAFKSAPVMTNDWINVKDKLPEIDTPVFAGYYYNDGFLFDTYVRSLEFDGTEDCWLWARCDHTCGDGDWRLDDDYSFLTHWMPLPAPPVIDEQCINDCADERLESANE